MICSGETDYHCVYGSCVTYYTRCPEITTKKCQGPNGYECPEGNCVFSDRSCIRPCGYVNSMGDKYEEKCPDYRGKCVIKSTEQTFHCPVLCREYTCSDGRCVEDYRECEKCFNKETCDNGNCYSSWERCDGYNSCADWSDERDCPLRPGAISAVCAASLAILLILLVFYWCYHKGKKHIKYDVAGSHFQEEKVMCPFDDDDVKILSAAGSATSVNSPPDHGHFVFTTNITSDRPDSLVPLLTKVRQLSSQNGTRTIDLGDGQSPIMMAPAKSPVMMSPTYGKRVGASASSADDSPIMSCPSTSVKSPQKAPSSHGMRIRVLDDNPPMMFSVTGNGMSNYGMRIRVLDENTATVAPSTSAKSPGTMASAHGIQMRLLDDNLPVRSPRARSPVPPSRSPVPPSRSPVPPSRSPVTPTRSPEPPSRSPEPPSRSPVPPRRSRARSPNDGMQTSLLDKNHPGRPMTSSVKQAPMDVEQEVESRFIDKNQSLKSLPGARSPMDIASNHELQIRLLDENHPGWRTPSSARSPQDVASNHGMQIHVLDDHHPGTPIPSSTRSPEDIGSNHDENLPMRQEHSTAKSPVSTSPDSVLPARSKSPPITVGMAHDMRMGNYDDAQILIPPVQTKPQAFSSQIYGTTHGIRMGTYGDGPNSGQTKPLVSPSQIYGTIYGMRMGNYGIPPLLIPPIQTKPPVSSSQIYGTRVCDQFSPIPESPSPVNTPVMLAPPSGSSTSDEDSDVDAAKELKSVNSSGIATMSVAPSTKDLTPVNTSGSTLMSVAPTSILNTRGRSPIMVAPIKSMPDPERESPQGVSATLAKTSASVVPTSTVLVTKGKSSMVVAPTHGIRVGDGEGDSPILLAQKGEKSPVSATPMPVKSTMVVAPSFGQRKNETDPPKTDSSEIAKPTKLASPTSSNASILTTPTPILITRTKSAPEAPSTKPVSPSNGTMQDGVWIKHLDQPRKKSYPTIPREREYIEERTSQV